MAGVKQFDQAQVLDQAMQVFWRRGYEATSIRDLTAATGLGRGSLYGAFGDKEGLFLAVIDHYAELVQGQLVKALQHPDPQQAIAQMFAVMIEHMSDANTPSGCLNTNTSLECSGRSERINRKIAERLGQLESAIYEVLLRAQADGRLPSGLDIRAYARFFLAINQGIAVLNRAFADPSMIRDVAKVATVVWESTCQA
ncbi:MAG: TetR/AcrR family transcriptional regulator [Cyanobacteria bacterium J06638_28]